MPEVNKPLVRRSMHGLRAAMFDVIEDLRAGRIQAKEAKEICSAARVILESIDTQLTVEATIEQGAKRLQEGGLPALPLAEAES